MNREKILGIIALLCAPCLLIDSAMNGFDPYQRSGFSGLLNFIYMAGWICSLAALKKLGAFGTGTLSGAIYFMQISFLVFGEAWGLYEMMQPGAGTTLYYVLDVFWPVSNAWMFITGLTILLNGSLKGWMRFIPLLVGCWLPFSVAGWIIFGRTSSVIAAAGIYAAVMWSLMAVVVIIISTRIKASVPAQLHGAAWLR